MSRRSAEENIEALRTLVSMSLADKPENVGHYLVRALWLGEGEDLSEVLSNPHARRKHPHLRLVPSPLSKPADNGK